MTADYDRLAEITANLERYIERRAQEIAVPRVAQVEEEAAARIAAVEAQAAADRQRANDLVKELGRQIAVLDRKCTRLIEQEERVRALLNAEDLDGVVAVRAVLAAMAGVSEVVP